MNKLKKILTKIKIGITALLGIITVTSTNVFAAGDTIDTNATPANVGNKLFGSVQNIAIGFGGGLIGLGLIMIAINMLINHKNPDARAEGMNSVITIGLAAAIIGSVSIVTGLIWGYVTK